MRYLIDGYNLLHAYLGPPATTGLEPARLRLLDRLCEFPRVAASAMTVVFDAVHAPAGIPVRATHRGIQLHFPRTQTADDFIEELIRLDPRPHTLTVVSNDNRLHIAARRRPCEVMQCIDWVEQMNRPAAPQCSAETPEKPTENATEAERWMNVFGGIDTTELNDFDDLR